MSGSCVSDAKTEILNQLDLGVQTGANVCVGHGCLFYAGGISFGYDVSAVHCHIHYRMYNILMFALFFLY